MLGRVKAGLEGCLVECSACLGAVVWGGLRTLHVNMPKHVPSNFTVDVQMTYIYTFFRKTLFQGQA